jgi:hypothetical protein
LFSDPKESLIKDVIGFAYGADDKNEHLVHNTRMASIRKLG